LFKTICYHYPSLGAALKENFSMTIDKHQHDAKNATSHCVTNSMKTSYQPPRQTTSNEQRRIHHVLLYNLE